METSESGLCGIANIGNTCWLNSIIQCLSHTTVLREFFLLNKYKDDVNQNIENQYILIETFNNLLRALWTNNGVLDPTPFAKLLTNINSEYILGEQQDSQEFLLLLIDELHNGVSYEISLHINGTAITQRDKIEIDSLRVWRDVFKKSYSTIVEEFYGQFIGITNCSLCENTSFKYDVFNHISLPITDNCETIYNCFDVFTGQEVLDDDNRVRCDNCNELSNARKNISIWKTSNILLISLKRFDMYGNKIDKHIDFPVVNLNLQKYINGYSKYQSRYDLYAVCNHYGALNYGHYTAYCMKNPDNWYVFDDDKINKIATKDVITNNAYILFYIRK
jgi:ubiquitin C-terminal hydrolase